MASLMNESDLSEVESELTNMLKGGDMEGLSPSEDDIDSTDLDALELEFSELSEFMSEREGGTEQGSKVSALIKTLENAQTLVTTLRSESGPEDESDDSLQKRLDQVTLTLNQADDLLKRLENEVREIREMTRS